MSVITADQVKQLREQTSAGLMDCKRALAETGGDFDKAVKVLRESGAAKAAKKADRSTREGLIVARVQNGAAVLAEVVCETDFVARNEKFQALANRVAAQALNGSDDGDVTARVAELCGAEVTALIASIGENMQVRRVLRWTSAGGFGEYIHMGGKIGVLVDFEGSVSDELKLDIAMHIAASGPEFIRREEVPAARVADEKDILKKQVDPNKPPQIQEKIIEGKLSSFYAQICLLEQPFIKDDKRKIRDVLGPAKVRRFARFAVGQG